MAGQPFKIEPPLSADELAQTALGRCLLAGRVIATVVSPVDGKHITVRFSAKAPPESPGGRWRTVPLFEAMRVYIDIPGKDLVQGDRVGDLNVRKSTLWATNTDTRRVNAARYILLAALGRLDGDKVLLSTTCLRCGRPLTDPVSIERSIGPECYGQVTGSVHERKGDPLSDRVAAAEERVIDAQARGNDSDVDRAWKDLHAATEAVQERAAFEAKLKRDEEFARAADAAAKYPSIEEVYDRMAQPQQPSESEADAAPQESAVPDDGFVVLPPGVDPRTLL